MWPANEFQISPAQVHFKKETLLCIYNVLTYSYQMQIHLCRQRFIITFLQLTAALLKKSEESFGIIYVSSTKQHYALKALLS